MIRSRFLSEWQGDSLDTHPDPYARIGETIEALEAERERILQGMQSWSAAWEERLNFYGVQIQRTLSDKEWRPGWNSLGEIQGNFTTFDYGVVAVHYIDEVLSALRIILSERPQKRESTGKVPRRDSKARRTDVEGRGTARAKRKAR